ncbi:MAG: hypothetical protein IJ673_01780, partial [Treponema sp.]|nr:hypothetical protein [Treponema sp.]
MELLILALEDVDDDNVLTAQGHLSGSPSYRRIWIRRAKVEFSQCNGRNERKRGSVNKNTQPPRSGTAVFVGGFPLGACFCNY